MSLDIDVVEKQRQEDEEENGKWVKFDIGKPKKLMFLPKPAKSGNTMTQYGETYQITFFVVDLGTKTQKEKEFQILGKKLQKLVIDGIKFVRNPQNSKYEKDVLQIEKLVKGWKVDPIESKDQTKK